MSDVSETSSHLVQLPTELLYSIFSYLPAKNLIKCREVCLRWKQVIDELFKSEVVWWRYGINDFKTFFNIARRKSRPGVSCYDLYKSLSLWPQLGSAEEEIDEFASASSVYEEIHGFGILGEGIIGVRTKGGIVYYNIETLRQANRGTIHGHYLKYVETEDSLILLNNLLHLFIIRTVVHSPYCKTKAYFDNVKLFMVLNNKVYLVNLSDEIYVCDLKSENLDFTFLQCSREDVLCLGYVDNQLHILTNERKVYKIDKNCNMLINTANSTTNLLDLLHKYNFLELMDWRVYYYWLSLLNQNMPDGPLRFLTIIRRYGDVFFVGTDWGLLRIYYAPYSNGELDLYNAEPVKQFNFSERSDCPVLSASPILQIDIAEANNGHTIFVGMPKKIAVINLTHDFKRSTSFSVKPSETQELITTV